jgi:isochorismate pyruvate lyase
MALHDDITDMPALRSGIATLDAPLMSLFAQRHALIDRAAEIIRADNSMPARSHARVDEVLSHGRRHAELLDLAPVLHGQIWRQLIDAAIDQYMHALKKDHP